MEFRTFSGSQILSVNKKESNAFAVRVPFFFI